MKDILIRSAFHQSVLKSAHECADTFVVDELGLKNGASRADIAVLNGKLIGYEIKTDRDTLIRLPNQIKAYSEVFDKVYIVTGSRHLSQIEDNIPNWWGIYLIGQKPSTEYKFTYYRRAKINPTKDTYGLVQLLWKDEVIQILTSALKFTLKSGLTKDELYGLLSTECTPNELSKIVLKYLKSRNSWRPNLKALS